MADYTTAIKLNPKYSAAFYNRAQLRATAGDHAGAAKDFEAARALTPNDVDTHVSLGIEYGELDRIDDEIASYKAALAISPHDHWAMRDLAITYGETKKWDKAGTALDAALALYPKDAGLHAWRGDVFEAQADLARARGQYDISLRIDTQDRQARYGRARIARTQKRFEDAINDYHVLIGEKADDTGAMADEIDTLIEKGDKKRGLELVGKYLAGFPDDAGLLIDQGRLRYLNNDDPGAINDYGRVLAAHPTQSAALFDRALVYYDQEHNDLAIRDLDAALKLTPADAETLEKLGEVYLYLDDYILALEFTDRAVTADPNRARAYEIRARVKRKMGDEPGASADEAQDKRLSAN